MTIQIDKKTLAIGILTLSALALAVLNLTAPPKARAAESVRGDQYFAVTGRVSAGGEGLYLTNRDGLMVVFTYDPNTKRIEPRAIKSVVEAFNGSGPAVPNRPGKR